MFAFLCTVQEQPESFRDGLHSAHFASWCEPAIWKRQRSGPTWPTGRELTFRNDIFHVSMKFHLLGQDRRPDGGRRGRRGSRGMPRLRPGSYCNTAACQGPTSPLEDFYQPTDRQDVTSPDQTCSINPVATESKSTIPEIANAKCGRWILADSRTQCSPLIVEVRPIPHEEKRLLRRPQTCSCSNRREIMWLWSCKTNNGNNGTLGNTRRTWVLLRCDLL